jgi:hypothetical protein
MFDHQTHPKSNLIRAMQYGEHQVLITFAVQVDGA